MTEDLANDTSMVKAHIAAAKAHQKAANSHLAAGAQAHTGARDATWENAQTAMEHSEEAQAASKLVYENSGQFKSVTTH